MRLGRKDDTAKIVDILTKANKSLSSDVNYHSPEKVSIISIVGMGGLGKTTLAQLVYKDEVVNKYFDQRIWVCLSSDFDVEKILIKIMESVTLGKFDNVSNFDLLVNKVQANLQGKKFLLVLDDLWNENIQQWERLKIPLLVGAQGSKILITTRNMQVADVVKGSIRPYQLEKLQEDECWSIMEKKAFSPGGATKTPTMTNIGKGIAKKCSGLPLAAKFLGSLMHSKNQESEWLSIRESDKDSWGTSSNVQNARSIEDIGEEYFDSLVWSSFLDVVEKNALDDITMWKMHDLVHDLGLDVVGHRECTVSKVSELANIFDVRRLQLISDDDSSTRCSVVMSQLKKLRTVIVLEPNNNLKSCTFSSNKKLRVLYFGRMAEACTEIAYPAANKLKHLRYIQISDLDLNGMMHDKYYYSKLYNLQTLVLSGCDAVQNILEAWDL
ncbi:putative disease resistance protein RGA3 [Papaver somniferum]|uniref:putative disease resistance protein RGA3 n=1 Tax=Papaver somniferum TaxID=3469 RepID=UPI000E6FA99C|nr:putative disease resistance protein RGA3 [Papaver somniferum]